LFSVTRMRKKNRTYPTNVLCLSSNDVALSYRAITMMVMMMMMMNNRRLQNAVRWRSFLLCLCPRRNKVTNKQRNRVFDWGTTGRIFQRNPVQGIVADTFGSTFLCLFVCVCVCVLVSGRPTKKTKNNKNETEIVNTSSDRPKAQHRDLVFFLERSWLFDSKMG